VILNRRHPCAVRVRHNSRLKRSRGAVDDEGPEGDHSVQPNVERAGSTEESR
jgi:hypothetical protein